MAQPKIFISWSGEQSRFVAAELRHWISKVIQTVDPWMSEIDINAGARWMPEIEQALAESKFGISCVTAANRNAPYLLFEAGAIVSSVKKQSFLVPYLIDVE